MKIIRKLIELLVMIETALTRCKAAKRAKLAAVRMALNGCR